MEKGLGKWILGILKLEKSSHDEVNELNHREFDRYEKANSAHQQRID